MVVMQRDLDRSVQRTLCRVLLLLAGALVLSCATLVFSTHRLGHSLQTLVADRVRPLSDLHAVSQVLNVELPRVIDPERPSEGRAAAVAQAFERLQRPWAVYQATWLTPEETELMRDAQRRLTELQRLLDAAPAAAERYARALQPLNQTLAALMHLQVQVAEQELQQGRQLGATAKALGLGLSLLGLLLCAYALQQLRQRVLQPLRVVADAVATLAAGERTDSPELKALSGDFAEVGEQLQRLRRSLGTPGSTV